MKRIGFIGIGSMGKPMALNLLKAGYELTAFSRNAGALAEIKSAGGNAAGSIAELAAAVEAVVTIVPADKEILEVYTSQGGLIDNLRDGAVCIEMTSARGETVRRLEECARQRQRKIRFIDAPVSGGVAGAASGNLTIMAGGDKGLIEEYMPVLSAMGSKIFYTGGLGSGKAVKMINQFLNAGNTCVAAEALFLARRMGLDLDNLCRIVNESSGSSYVFKNNVPKFMVPQDYEQGFRLELMKKDVGLAFEQAAADDIALPVLGLVFEVYQSMCNQGYGRKNYSVVAEWVKMLNTKR